MSTGLDTYDKVLYGINTPDWDRMDTETENKKMLAEVVVLKLVETARHNFHNLFL